MRIENVKLDWHDILKPYIEHLSKTYAIEMIETRLEPIIDALNTNSTKSMAIFSEGKPAAYAFLVDAGIFTDRVYVSAGFRSPGDYSEERLKAMLSWVSESSPGNDIKVYLDKIFNAPDSQAEILESGGYRIVKRVGMTRHLDSRIGSLELPSGYSLRPISDISVEQYSDLEYQCYRNTSDEPMFSTKREDRVNFTTDIFLNEPYGSLVYAASRLIYSGEEPCGGILVTKGMPGISSAEKCFLASVFLSQDHRGKGLSRVLIGNAVDACTQAGFREMTLTVNLKNPALEIYKKLGFVRDEKPEEFLAIK